MKILLLLISSCVGAQVDFYPSPRPVVTTNSVAPGKAKIASASVLTINDGCSSGDPCNILVGSTTYSFTASATATITSGSGSGTAKIFVSSSGTVTVQHPTAAGVTISCVGCTAQQVASPAFPSGSVPLYNATITSGAWTAIQDLRTFVGGGSPGPGLLARGFGANFGKCGGTGPDVNDVAYAPTIPYACTISGYALAADTGTFTAKVWKIASGTALPTSSNSINTSGLSLSSNTVLQSTTVSDFTTTAVTAGDIIAITLTAVSGPTCAQVFIQCTI